ncbi:hypothetical protein D3C76_1174790 [compost metagenome]
MVPDSECRMPTLMVSAAWMLQLRPIAAMDALRVKALIRLRRFIVLSPWNRMFCWADGDFAKSVSKGCAEWCEALWGAVCTMNRGCWQAGLHRDGAVAGARQTGLHSFGSCRYHRRLRKQFRDDDSEQARVCRDDDGRRVGRNGAGAGQRAVLAVFSLHHDRCPVRRGQGRAAGWCASLRRLAAMVRQPGDVWPGQGQE